MRKNKTGKVIIVALASVILLGGIGAVGGWIGYEKGQEIVDNIDLFTDVKIVDQEKIFTGETFKLDMTLPENATETHVIKKDDVVVLDSAVKAVGVYKYDIVVTIGKATRNFKATLTIKEKAVENVSPKITPRLAKVSDTEYKVTATLTPVDTTENLLSWNLAFKNPSSTWATGKKVYDYISVIPDSSSLNCTLKLKAAFAEQIILTVSIVGHEDIKGSCTMDYEKKLLTHSLSFTGITENTSVLTGDTTFVHSSTYSIYTIDKTYSESFSIKDLETESSGEYLQDSYNWYMGQFNSELSKFINGNEIVHFDTLESSFTTFINSKLSNDSKYFGTYSYFDREEGSYEEPVGLTFSQIFNHLKGTTFTLVGSFGSISDELTFKFGSLATAVSLDQSSITF